MQILPQNLKLYKYSMYIVLIYGAKDCISQPKLPPPQILADQLLNPISTKGADHAHHIITWLPPRISDPPTALNYYVKQHSSVSSLVSTGWKKNKIERERDPPHIAAKIGQVMRFLPTFFRRLPWLLMKYPTNSWSDHLDLDKKSEVLNRRFSPAQVFHFSFFFNKEKW